MKNTDANKKGVVFGDTIIEGICRNCVDKEELKNETTNSSRL